MKINPVAGEAPKRRDSFDFVLLVEASLGMEESPYFAMPY